MALTLQDLQPKNFKINIKGVEVDCKPPRLSHTLIISKVGETFKNVSKTSRQELVQAEVDFDWVVEELMPDLKGIQLDISSIIEIIEKLLDEIEPDENQTLKEQGVSIDTDPKAEKIG